jgi:hypothetical protein
VIGSGERFPTPHPPIDSTGGSDVTADLQGWLNSVPDGSRLIIPAGARYRIDGTLATRAKKNWTITCPKGTKPVLPAKPPRVSASGRNGSWTIARTSSSTGSAPKAPTAVTSTTSP